MRTLIFITAFCGIGAYIAMCAHDLNQALAYLFIVVTYYYFYLSYSGSLIEISSLFWRKSVPNYGFDKYYKRLDDFFSVLLSVVIISELVLIIFATYGMFLTDLVYKEGDKRSPLMWVLYLLFFSGHLLSSHLSKFEARKPGLDSLNSTIEEQL